MAASVLVLVLAYSAFAGDVQYPNVVPPPPPSTITGDMQFPGVASPSETTNGEIPFPGATESTLTETALNMLQSMLSLF
jgi:hypothetical protein